MKKAIIIFILNLSLASSAYSLSLPAGNYQNTCVNCQVGSDAILNCSCSDKQQILRKTSLLVTSDCQFIENLNGHLTCTRYENNPSNNQGKFTPTNLQHYEAGPIWDNDDAKRKCPTICTNHQQVWIGGWRTTVPDKMSECDCADANQ